MRNLYCFLVLAIIAMCCASACKNKHASLKNDLVTNPRDMDDRVTENIKTVLKYAEQHGRLTADTVPLPFIEILKKYYTGDEKPLWCSKEKWNATADSFLLFLQNAAYSGLYSQDYQYQRLQRIKNILTTDSVKRTDAFLWANAELAFTNNFMAVLQDLKQGRLHADSAGYKNDSSLHRTFFIASLHKLAGEKSFAGIIQAVQPAHEGYKDLKAGIKKFIDSMDPRVYSLVNFPYKDTVAFVKSLRKRFAESNISLAVNADSATLSETVKKYQQLAKLKTTGKIDAELVRRLNNNDHQKFNRIAVTLDRYKQLPQQMPSKYIWVNLPSFYLKVINNDTLALESKIIVGKTATPTPIITSAISDIVIYPTWTVPTSIITKDMLPGLKRNVNYLARRGLYLLNGKDQRIDPAVINWAKYTKGIPFRIQQGSGDGNALGVIKFNFENPYSVYLHDTNQRYLFKNGSRNLSHGCVRVQEWKALANIIIRNDSLMAKRPDTLKVNTDSITNWIANKEKHRVDVKNKFPLFIRYFSCEGVNNSIRFYEDIYGDDKDLIQKYFAGK